MAVFMVTWNLNRERANYAAARQTFIQHLERYDNIQDSGLETVRWLSSASTVGNISEDLRQALDGNDRLFVVKLRSEDHAGWVSQSTWQWISARL